MTFLLPYSAALAAVGTIFAIAQTLRLLGAARQPNRGPKRAMAVSVLTLSVAAALTYAARWPVPLPGVDDRPNVEAVARFLAEQTDEDDLVFARTGVSEPIQYHLAHLGQRFDRVGSQPPKKIITEGVLVRQRGASLGSKLPEILRDYRIDLLLFEDDAYQAWRVVRSDSEFLAQHADADGEGL